MKLLNAEQCANHKNIFTFEKKRENAPLQQQLIQQKKLIKNQQQTS